MDPEEAAMQLKLMRQDFSGVSKRQIERDQRCLLEG